MVRSNCQSRWPVTERPRMRKFPPKRHASRSARPNEPQHRHRTPERDRDGPVILYGWHSVKAALENPTRRLHRLLATENAARRLAEDGVQLPANLEMVRPE